MSFAANGNKSDFYEEYIVNLTDKEQERFFQDNPDFMLEVEGSVNSAYFENLRRRVNRTHDEHLFYNSINYNVNYPGIPNTILLLPMP